MKKITKKWTLFLIATFVTFFGIGYTLLKGTQALSEEVPANPAFDDIKFYECVVDAYNKEHKTKISYDISLTDEQLKSITKLSCFARFDITSASGIEKLTSLTTLDMHHTGLTDDIDLSNNTLLTYLRIEYAELTSLDLSNNVNLTQLYISDNKISDLNITDNLLLTDLDVSNNDLTSLNVENILSLKTLDASDNQLTSLNVKNNHSLTSLNLSGNQLESLDVSENIELINLIVGADNSDSGGPYDGYGNKLTTLDVSNNTKLQKLAVSNNSLTSLDVSNNNELLELTLYNNQITELDVSLNEKLKILNLGFAYGCGNTFSGLACGRKYGNNISSLSLTNNVNLEELYVANNQLTSIDLSNNKNIKELQLSNNHLTSLNVVDFENLAKLTVDENDLSSLNLTDSNNVRILFVNGNQLTGLNVENMRLLDFLDASNNQLKNLNLGNNQLLSYLDLSNNRLTMFDITKNENLTVLFISDNKLENLDLSQNLKLERLYINSNQLSNLDISKNISLQYLNITDNPYSETVYVYKGDNVSLGNNVKIASHLGWNSPVWTSTDVSIVSIDDGIATAINVGNVEVSGVVDKTVFREKYLTTSSVNVVEINSDKYEINEENNYIFVGLDDINAIKDNVNISDNNISLMIEDNKLYVKYSEKVLKTFNIVRIASDYYDLDEGYIYTGKEDIKLDKITNINCTEEVSDNKLLIKYGDDILAEYLLASASSDYYDLSKEYIYIGNMELDLDKITNINCTEEVGDNKLLIKYGDDILAEYLLASASSDYYDLSKEYIYIGNMELDLDKITNINCIKSVDNNKLLIKYGNDILTQYDLEKILFKDYIIVGRYVLVPLNADYETFVGNIVLDNKFTYKIFKDDIEVTNGNILSEMILKIYYGNKEIDQYVISEEYINFDNGIIFDKNDMVLSNIGDGITVNQMIDMIDTSGDVTFVDKNDVIMASDSILKTGDMFKVNLLSQTVTYKVSISGDVDGDGIISKNDIELSSSHLIKGNLITGIEYLRAFDYNNDDTIDINDIIKMAKRLRDSGDTNE